jgi:hypothetical protein
VQWGTGEAVSGERVDGATLMREGLSLQLSGVMQYGAAVCSVQADAT